MKYCRSQTPRGPQFGEILEHDQQLWIERLIPPFEEDLATGSADAAFQPIPLAGAPLLAPVIPSKIVCIGRNYRDHVAELGNEVPAEPLLFLKAPSAILAPGGAIRIPALSQRVDFEGEVAIVIGEQCSHIGEREEVSRYIRGYTVVNDVTARDLQKKDGQWSRAKGFDTFCPVGPIVTDEVDPGAGINVTTRLNGEVRQRGNTRDLLFPIARLLRHISAAMTLYPGDLISTGTPAGVAAMRPGDRVEVTVEGIGTLSNSVA